MPFVLVLCGCRVEGWGGRSPSPTSTRGPAPPLLSQRAPEHDGVGPASDSSGHVPAGAHPAVGDDVDVLAGLQVVAHPGRGGVGDRGRLRHADLDHAARSADAARTHADQNPHGARAHEVEPSSSSRSRRR